MEDKYERLRLGNQLCFPLYVCSKEIVKQYKPFLDRLNLTYTQYITMMVMWENEQINVKELGDKLYLDSGTLTPLLKKLEQKSYVKRSRDKADERVLNVTVTEEGKRLRDEALSLSKEMSSCIKLSKEESQILFKTIKKILDNIEHNSH